MELRSIAHMLLGGPIGGSKYSNLPRLGYKGWFPD